MSHSQFQCTIKHDLHIITVQQKRSTYTTPVKISSIAPLRFVMTIDYKANNANNAVNTKLTIHIHMHNTAILCSTTNSAEQIITASNTSSLTPL